MSRVVRAAFELQDCRGRPILSVVLPVVKHDDYTGFDYATKHNGRVLNAAGVSQFVCDGCYDSYYRVKFLEFV